MGSAGTLGHWKSLAFVFTLFTNIHVGFSGKIIYMGSECSLSTYIHFISDHSEFFFSHHAIRHENKFEAARFIGCLVFVLLALRML